MTDAAPIDRSGLPFTSTHSGNYRVEVEDGRVVALHPYEHDPDPSPIGAGIVDAIDAPSRITMPMVRRSWLDAGPGTDTDLRGTEPFVEVSWDRAIELVAGEIERVRSERGNSAIYAGSYGWASAGRFHHAQSQLKRFLNCIGGFTSSVNTYSFAAGEVIVPHVLGSNVRQFAYDGPTWPDITEHADLVVAFGGIRVNNGQISQGGGGQHVQRIGVEKAASAGVDFVNVSPIRSDLPGVAEPLWLPLRPNTDTALMLGLAHTLIVEDLYDRAFVDSHTAGFAEYHAYLSGTVDGRVKSADWAAEICELDAEEIRVLARRMANARTLVNVSWSLTRQHHGELTWWAGIALAALLGQIGQRGRGLALGLSSVNTVGHRRTELPAVALPQGHNPVESFIPVARVADMLLGPGEPFTYDGGSFTYPDIDLVWWAGGNPFHHHQDLRRLEQAWQRPATVIVNDWCWTSTARRADIVLPVATSLERTDVSITYSDSTVTYMAQAVDSPAGALTDHEIFRRLADRLGVLDDFSEGRSESEWVRYLYDSTAAAAADEQIAMPTFDELRRIGTFEVEAPSPDREDAYAAFGRDPIGHPLGTPSGRIELASSVVSGFGLDDHPGHPAWLEPREWLGRPSVSYPLHAVTNQPTSKLHSQLDQGAVSRAAKLHGREPVSLHPQDAAARGVGQHDVVRVFNDRGSCLATAVITDDIRPSVVKMPTGAWYDPDATGMCVHGNPNAFTIDLPTSGLAQGCSAQTCLVEIERWNQPMPPVTVHEPPAIVSDET